jgi:isochorismate synthase
MKMNSNISAPLFDFSSWMHRHSFVAWRQPGEMSYHGFKAFVETMSQEVLPETEAFIFSPFNDNGKYPAIVFHPLVDQLKDSTTLSSNAIPVAFPTDIPDSKATYCKRIDQLTGMMKDGSLHKCVLSRRIDAVDPEEDMAPELFKQLCKLYPNAFVSLIHIPTVFTWLGASPERLLKIKDQKAHTTSLAATRPFMGVLPDISAWNDKEKEEQQLVTDFIFNVLERGHIHAVESDGPRSMQAGNLLHLKTDIRFTIDAHTDISSLIKALHPTPAVCGLPREEALQMIHAIEPHDREYYAGYLGPVSKDALEFYVNLRCMRWVDGKPSLFVGGGITAGSVPEQEWEETNFKAHTLLDVIEKICNLAGKNSDAH